LTGPSPTTSVAPWHGKPQAIVFIAFGVLALLTGLVLVFFDIRDTGFISAYRAASTCSSPVDALSSDTCRYQGEAQVVSTTTDAGHKAVVSFPALPGRTFSTFFPTGGEPDNSALKAGGTAQAELWSGKVTRLAGKVTNDDPEGYPTSGLLELAAFFAVLGLPLLVIGISFARSAFRTR
jgi:hypothetical protein